MGARTLRAALFFVSVTGALICPAGLAFADTVLDVDPDISEDTTWTKEGSPYLVSGELTIDANAALSIEPGTVVEFGPSAASGGSGGMAVLGRIFAMGTPEDPILFTARDGKTMWDGIVFSNQTSSSALDYVVVRYPYAIVDLQSNGLSISHARIENAAYGIFAKGSTLSLDTVAMAGITGEALDVSAHSAVTFKDVTLSHVNKGIELYTNSSADISDLSIDTSENEAVAVYADSDLHLASSTITNVSSSYGAIEVFSNSSADIGGMTLDTVKEALSVFGNASTTLSDSTFSNMQWYDGISAFDSGAVTARHLTLVNGSGDGIDLFSGGTVIVENSEISGFRQGTGVADYGSSPSYPANSLSLVATDIHDNDLGLGLYANNSTYRLSRNAIRKNTSGGLIAFGTGTIDATNNYWGDASGPRNDAGNLSGLGDAIFYVPGSTVSFAPWLTRDPFACATPGACSSNVMFLPGIEGSRLYEGTQCGKSAEERLWEPFDSIWSAIRGAGDRKIKELSLNGDGASVCADIYVKEGDILNSVGGSPIYQALTDEMNGLKVNGTISDWKPVAYDWRLSLDALLSNGTKRGDAIYYEEASSTPYIEQTLRGLAASSKTGKVTIVAHSNGGLIAKALLEKLGEESVSLVDKVIMVGVPQTGAPEDLGETLVGYNAGIYTYGFTILSSAAVRSFAQNSPMAYHLLPSEGYLMSIASDTAHSVVRFSGSGYAKEQAAYGSAITRSAELNAFLLAKEGGRAKPKENDVNSPEILNPALTEYGVSRHAALDAWIPPVGIEIDQIAGWGTDTVAGIDFYTTPPSFFSLFRPKRAYRPTFIEDGDGTVPVPSALAIASSTNVKRYWVDLSKINNIPGAPIKFSHSDIFEIPALEAFLKGLIENNSTILPEYISSSQPTPLTTTKKLMFFLRSSPMLQASTTLESTTSPPRVTLRIKSPSKNKITGIAEDNSVTEDIPDSTYGEFGDLEYVIVPEGEHYELFLQGHSSPPSSGGASGAPVGLISLDIQEAAGDTATSTATLADIPITASTTATLDISGGIDTASPLVVDENGDGSTVITVTPIPGETVNYKPPTAGESMAPSTAAGSAGSGLGYFSYTPSVPPVTTATVATLTPSTTIVAVKAPLRPVTQHIIKHLDVVPPTGSPPSDTFANSLQTAAVYNASLEDIFFRISRAFYNELYKFWISLKTFFDWK